MLESHFEAKLIDHICNLSKTVNWEYRQEIKTEEALWNNFRDIVNQKNQKLGRKLLDSEFEQIRNEIRNCNSPYESAKLIYGTNGVFEIGITTEDGKPFSIQISDQRSIGAGNSIYQVVNQVKTVRLDGHERIFDVLLLIDGLPMICLELKQNHIPVDVAMTQLENYAYEGYFSGIFSTVQTLVGMTETSVLYRANTGKIKAKKEFRFKYKNINNEVVYSAYDFSREMLTIPSGHKFATSYIVLDSKNKQTRILRPYQIHAIEKQLQKITKFIDSKGTISNKLGYVWHTTGSGKTITSFKTAWHASLFPGITRVIYLVDRNALDNQTTMEFQNFDPNPSTYMDSEISSANSSGDLMNKLSSLKNKLIITTIQKIDRLVKSEKFIQPKGRTLFIVDEAHRSTKTNNFSTMMSNLMKKFAGSDSIWLGYTGTPNFEETNRTFGDLIHAYTIKEAISDGNVLGFQIDFVNTIELDDNPEDDDFNGTNFVEAYDKRHEHVEIVAKDIFDNYQKRSADYRYNAILTVKVGANMSSVPRVIEYYNEFKKLNNQSDKQKLKIACLFSKKNAVDDSIFELSECMKEYGLMFYSQESRFTTQDPYIYERDVANKIKNKELDLIIVIDKLLTGFDAPRLNTLYIDRVIKDANLIQAFSRTNRVIDNETKEYGLVISYRYPKRNKKYMDEALLKYSNILSAKNTGEGSVELGEIVAKPYNEVLKNTIDIVNKLNKDTSHFTEIPKDSDLCIQTLRNINTTLRNIERLSQYTENEVGEECLTKYDEGFYKMINLSDEIINRMVGGFTHDLRQKIADDRGVEIEEIDFHFNLVEKVFVKYDYLMGLLQEYAKAIKNNDEKVAKKIKNDIKVNTSEIASDIERGYYDKFVNSIEDGSVDFDSIKGLTVEEFVNKVKENAVKKVEELVENFIYRWCIDATVDDIYKLVKDHSINEKNFRDDDNQLDYWIGMAKDRRKQSNDEFIKNLPPIKAKQKSKEEFKFLAIEIAKVR